MTRKVLLLLAISFFLFACGGGKKNTSTSGNELSSNEINTYDKIKTNGVLRAITGYSSTSYFIHRGKPMGFEYDLLHNLAEYLNVELKIVVAKDIESAFEMLEEDEGDILAFSLTKTAARKDRVIFSEPVNHVEQVLVQRSDAPDSLFVKRLSDLEGKKVTVRNSSSYLVRLKNLREENGIELEIDEAEREVSTEELIRKVSSGEIDFTVADENIALINQIFLGNLDVSVPMSLEQEIAWAFRKNESELVEKVDFWIDSIQSSAIYNIVYNKYYKSPKQYAARLSSESFTLESGKISAYDDYIISNTENTNWDWKLVASQIFHESRFDANAVSWAGAVGLMQLMPQTAARFGVRDPRNPSESIRAGVEFLEWLEEYWKDNLTDTSDIKQFVLASYNIGPGHVKDAQRLAEKYEGEGDDWELVSKYLELKSKKEYYTDEVVNHGYCRGYQATAYVKGIFDLYDHYLSVLSDEEESDIAMINSNLNPEN